MSKKRKKLKFPALDARKNLKIRQELIDYDYVDKLSVEDKTWLNKFTEEYISASFKKDKAGKHSKGNIHKAKYRTDCFKRNNDRNNDVHGVARINNVAVEATTQILDRQYSKENAEEEIITAMDAIKETENQ